MATKSDIEFIQQVAKDFQVCIDAQKAQNIFEQLTGDEGYDPQGQEYYYRLKEYFIN